LLHRKEQNLGYLGHEFGRFDAVLKSISGMDFVRMQRQMKRKSGIGNTLLRCASPS
jgi:hypothetical protein